MCVPVFIDFYIPGFLATRLKTFWNKAEISCPYSKGFNVFGDRGESCKCMKKESYLELALQKLNLSCGLFLK